MDNLNFKFFEEYKRIDKLCGEIYQSKQGVTDYIDQMKAASWNDYRNIPNWKTDLDQLKRVRHIRNHLAHEEGAFDKTACTQNDIDWMQSFYERIMNQSDPMARLYQKSKLKERKLVQTPISTEQTYIDDHQNDQSGRKHTFLWIIIFFVIVTAVLGLVMVGYILSRILFVV